NWVRDLKVGRTPGPQPTPGRLVSAEKIRSHIEENPVRAGLVAKAKRVSVVERGLGDRGVARGPGGPPYCRSVVLRMLRHDLVASGSHNFPTSMSRTSKNLANGLPAASYVKITDIWRLP